MYKWPETGATQLTLLSTPLHLVGAAHLSFPRKEENEIKHKARGEEGGVTLYGWRESYRFKKLIPPLTPPPSFNIV